MTADGRLARHRRARDIGSRHGAHSCADSSCPPTCGIRWRSEDSGAPVDHEALVLIGGFLFPVTVA